MLLIVDNSKGNEGLSSIKKLFKMLKQNKIEYCILNTCKNIEQFKDKIKGIILTGSPLKLSESLKFNDFYLNVMALNLFPNIPVLGICFGCQLLHIIHGGKLKNQGHYNPEQLEVNLDITHLLFKNNKSTEIIKFNFSDLPLENKHFKTIARVNINKKKIACAFEYTNKHFGCLFHPEYLESTHFILKNFYNFCNFCN